MRITIEIPDNAVKMFMDMVDALRTIAKTVEVETKDDIIQAAEQLKKTVEEEGAKKVKRNLDAFQKLADENKPKVTIQDVRAIMAELLREAGKEAVQELLQKRGAKKLTEVNPKHYAELKAEAEEILEGLR